jgi:hypothetical protein
MQRITVSDLGHALKIWAMPTKESEKEYPNQG